MLVKKPSMAGVKQWVVTMIEEMVLLVSNGAVPMVAVDMDWAMFLDATQCGKQGRINRKEPGCAAVGLTALKRMTHVKDWLFKKYEGIAFLDKNPDREDGKGPWLEWPAWKSARYSMLCG